MAIRWLLGWVLVAGFGGGAESVAGFWWWVSVMGFSDGELISGVGSFGSVCRVVVGGLISGDGFRWVIKG